MRKATDDLNYINWLKTTVKKLSRIDQIISDSQQHQDLDNQELALVEEIYAKLYWPEIVTYGKDNTDASKLKVNRIL